MDLYIQENPKHRVSSAIEKTIMKFKIPYKVITIIPEALPTAKEPGCVSEPWLAASQEGLQGPGQCVLIKHKWSSSFF